MIIKSSLGTGFQGVLLYIQKEGKDLRENEKPQIIVKNNVWGNPNVMARQMHNHSNKSSRLKSPVLHLSFAFAPEDKITPEKEIEVVKSAMQHFGISEEKFQYVLARHNDTENNHYHLVLNRFDLNNNTLDTSWIKNDCVGIADRVEQEHDLHRVEGRTRIYDIEKNTYLTTFKNKKREKNVQNTSVNLTEYQTKIQSAVREVLADKSVTTQEELTSELAKKNVQAKVQIDENTNKIKGISYRYDKKLSVKGGDIGYNASVVSQKLEENISVKIIQPELAKPNLVPGAESIPGPITKVEPKTIRPISDFDFIIKSKGEEYGFVGYSKDFKGFKVQTKEGKIMNIKNDKDYTFSKVPSKNLNSIELDLLNKGKKLIIKEKTPYKIYKSKTNESILFSNLTEDECFKNGLNTVDTFTSQDIKNDFDDSSISDVDRRKKKPNQKHKPS